MIQKAIDEKLTRIFGLKKVTFDAPGESIEQDVMFVEVEKVLNSIKDGRHVARLSGRLFMYSQAEKIPFGSLSKRIQRADAADTIDFFFFDFEENVRRFQNIVGRSLSFVFFFNGQYDPDIGIINELTITTQVNE